MPESLTGGLMATSNLKSDVRRLLQFDDPRERPIYGIREAAHYLLMPPATLRSWALGRSYPTKQGRKRFKPIILLPDKKLKLLSFYNLAEAHVLNAFRREHGVTLSAVRRAIDYITKRFDAPHPLIDHQFQTDGVALFVEELGRLIDASAQGQTVLTEALQDHLARIDRDPQGVVQRLYPFTRGYPKGDARRIVIDPQVAFGRPVLRGTRIPTAVIAERYKAGESIRELSDDYGRAQEEIEEALRCELRTTAA